VLQPEFASDITAEGLVGFHSLFRVNERLQHQLMIHN